MRCQLAESNPLRSESLQAADELEGTRGQPNSPTFDLRWKTPCFVYQRSSSFLFLFFFFRQAAFCFISFGGFYLSSPSSFSAFFYR